MNPHPVDGQWLDFYALLDVPVGADEDTIRKRIGKVYSEAAANSDHRDISRRLYFQALVERVLPQGRRVLLDPEWRAKYDRQHILHTIGDPSAQDYVSFIASMRGKDVVAIDDSNLPQRLQEDIKIAREVVECAWQGTQLDLLPSKAVSGREEAATPEATPEPQLPAPLAPPSSIEVHAVAPPATTPPATTPPATTPPTTAPPAAVPQPVAQAATPVSAPPQQMFPAPPATSAPQAGVVPQPVVEEIKQSGEPVRAQVITAQEAAEIRRRRASNPDAAPFATPTTVQADDGSIIIPRRKGRKAPTSRVVVGDARATNKTTRLISSTSMNLMIAIVGVLLTITVQRFSSTPAVATNTSRTPIFVNVSSEMEDAMRQAETEWERTPDGANYDLIVQSVDSRAGLRRALGQNGAMPDAWIPSDSLWAERYNTLAPSLKRDSIDSEQPIAQTPMVLVARADRAAELRRLFPNHQISSWNALRAAVVSNAQGHLGLTDPQRTATGAIARVSMAREWGASRGLNATQAAQNPQFWVWMKGFEDNASTAATPTGDMVKDLVLGTTGRYWWGIAYESDALDWMNQGKELEIYYLPRTSLADHPFCYIERVGAPLEVAQGRANFEKFLRSPAMQKQLLDSGFRPVEVGLNTKTPNNPFLNAKFRANGARAAGLPRDERTTASAIELLAQQWGKHVD